LKTEVKEQIYKKNLFNRINQKGFILEQNIAGIKTNTQKRCHKIRPFLFVKEVA